MHGIPRVCPQMGKIKMRAKGTRPPPPPSPPPSRLPTHPPAISAATGMVEYSVPVRHSLLPWVEILINSPVQCSLPGGPGGDQTMQLCNLRKNHPRPHAPLTTPRIRQGPCVRTRGLHIQHWRDHHSTSGAPNSTSGAPNSTSGSPNSTQEGS